MDYFSVIAILILSSECYCIVPNFSPECINGHPIFVRQVRTYMYVVIDPPIMFYEYDMLVIGKEIAKGSLY